MFAVHFYENKTKVLNQALRSIPSVGEEIKIKGRKGKVVNITEIDENTYHVYIEFEKIVEKNVASKDLGKKKRR
ncbi:hypothetical protein [Psychrobacillus lasiicapitis]|uniref:Uncharacterized protein n=1 Tax=Psychrobacillus lasiicapitis TaxID=1636719 RepID=A0A544TGQ7_9BACI|nr:hypothetical protein [Psychrobacillus lasiicapitis]TQR16621.1 hypothetical protein FG382_00155 [Psychrobacillus lasiicapitis]GGA28618.1 hypothetical protein GCM10011384_17570 [Psychrobacillus lasiicapitis]